MKTHAVRLFLLTTLITVLTTTIAQADSFDFAIDEFPPFVDSTAPGYGLGPRIISAALASQSHQARFHFLPWPRAYRMALEGQIDGTFPWTDQGNRRELFTLSAPVFEHRFSLVFAPGKAQPWQEYDDLDGLHFGTVTGYAIAEDLYQWIAQTDQHLEEVNSEALLFRMLAYNRFDVAAFDRLAARGYIQSLQHEVPLVSELEIDDRTVETSYTVVLMPLDTPRSRQLQRILADGLAAIRANGTYVAILNSQ